MSIDTDGHTRPFVAVLDFGGQYAHLIANRIRRLGEYSVILPPDADVIAMERLISFGVAGEVWQMPTVLVPLAVDGDRECVVIRPISSEEAMTARFTRLPWEVVESISEGISSLHGVSVVFCDITNKPPATIEWE